MLTQKNIKEIKGDIVKILTIKIIVRWLQTMKIKKSFYTQKWCIKILSTILGFAIYRVIISKHIKVNTKSKKFNSSLQNTIKFATVFITVQAITSSLNDFVPKFTNIWIKNISLILIGRFIYDYIIESHIDPIRKQLGQKFNIFNDKTMVNDILRVGCGLYLSNYNEFTNIDTHFLIKFSNIIVGMFIFYKGTKLYL